MARALGKCGAVRALHNLESLLARSKPPYNDVFGTYTLRAFLVKVYPAPEGAPEGVWLDPKEFKPWLATPSDPTVDPSKEGLKA